MYILFSSFGNDSCALIQYAVEQSLPNVTILYSDTGWAHPAWRSRIMSVVQKTPYKYVKLSSVGMVNLVRQKKAWPRHGMQFCTEHLKIKPALEWLDEHDPDKVATCMVGIRREESARRRSFPMWTEQSEKHGGRSLWAPLANYTSTQRDELLSHLGILPLSHRSLECYPCVNSNRAQLRLLAKERIDLIEKLEREMGLTSQGKPRTMFRPYHHQGATGIRQVVEWAHSEWGKYDATSDCDSGMCGD